jgi:hypothetical protein
LLFHSLNTTEEVLLALKYLKDHPAASWTELAGACRTAPAGDDE